MRLLAILLLVFSATWAVAAVSPEEIMDDPALQARAMKLYSELRCVRCRSETIESSNADWAQDARAVVRERLLAGDSDQEVLDFFVARYKEYVLMDPPMSLNNAILWLAGPILLLVGGAIAVGFVKGRAQPQPAEGLSEAEAARLAEILRETDE